MSRTRLAVGALAALPTLLAQPAFAQPLLALSGQPTGVQPASVRADDDRGEREDDDEGRVPALQLKRAIQADPRVIAAKAASLAALDELRTARKALREARQVGGQDYYLTRTAYRAKERAYKKAVREYRHLVNIVRRELLSGSAGSTKPTPTPTPAPTATPTPTPTPTGGPTPTPTTTAPAGVSGTFVGNAVTYDYGTVRVTIKVVNGHVASASATYPVDLPRTQAINVNSIPLMNARAVSAGTSAGLARTWPTSFRVSGATLTTPAYRSSLASALLKARI